MSIEDALHRKADTLRQEMAAWDQDAFLRRLGERIAAQPVPAAPARRRQAGRGPIPARPADVRPASRPHQPATDSTPLLTHEEELVRLCEDAVTVPEGTVLLERFLADFEPSGARVFACLLYLAEKTEHAVFWWRFACGGEDGMAAYCLTLHTRASGQARQEQAWSAAVHQLRFDPERHWPQPDRTGGVDQQRLTDVLHAHVRTEPEDDPVLLPTSELPKELITL